MMTGGDSSDRLSKTRAVLGDLTNRLFKRGFSEREESGIERFDFNGEDSAKCIRVSLHTCSDINSSKANVVSSISNITNENRDDANVLGFGCTSVSKSSDDGHRLDGKNVAVYNSKYEGGNKDMKVMDLGGETAIYRNVNELADDDNDKADTNGEISCFGDGSLPKLDKMASEVAMDSSEISNGKDYLSLVDCGRQNAFQSVNIEDDDDELRDSFPVHISGGMSETGGDCPHNCKNFESKASSEGTQSDISVYQNDVDSHNADDIVVSSQCGSIDCTVLPESQESRVFGVEKSIELKKGDGCASNVGPDSIKDCSCSFCTKAAHIWLDLNYQDIKARVSAMRKVQKEATILAERSIKSMVTEKRGAESLTTVSKLESDLTYQWRSLFQRMAGISEEEGNQLEARLPPLIGLIQKCKTDLALMNAQSSEKH